MFFDNRILRHQVQIRRGELQRKAANCGWLLSWQRPARKIMILPTSHSPSVKTSQAMRSDNG